MATLLGLVVRPLGQAVGWVAWVFLAYTIDMVRLTARMPHASVPLKIEGWMVVVYYVALGGLTWWLAQAKERRGELWAKFSSRLETKGLVGASVILLVLAFFAWRALPDGRLHVVFLDVGQGVRSSSKPSLASRCWWMVGQQDGAALAVGTADGFLGSHTR